MVAWRGLVKGEEHPDLMQQLQREYPQLERGVTFEMNTAGSSNVLYMIPPRKINWLWCALHSLYTSPATFMPWCPAGLSAVAVVGTELLQNQTSQGIPLPKNPRQTTLQSCIRLLMKYGRLHLQASLRYYHCRLPVSSLKMLKQLMWHLLPFIPCSECVGNRAALHQRHLRQGTAG